jgi:hypothetical protein
VTSIDALVPPDRTVTSAYVTLNEYVRLEAYPSSYGDTIYWTVTHSPKKPGQYLLLIAGRPSSIDATRHDEYFYTYRRKPGPLRYMGFERVCRDNSLTADSAPGAVKRYGTPANFPDGHHGLNPHTAEEVLGLADSLIGTPPAGAKTVVSDRIDVAPYMLSAVLSGAESWLARLKGANVEGALSVYARDMRMAMEADSVASIAGRRKVVSRHPENASIPYSGTASTPRSLGYYSPSQPDTT